MKRFRLWIALGVLLALAGLLYFFYGGTEAPPGQSPLVSLSAANFDQLKQAFNNAPGTIRVIALLSPT